MIIGLQIIWALFCVAWNGYGLWLVEYGHQPVAPTASLSVAILCFVFALIFWFFYKKRLKWPYIILSALTVLLASYAVYGGFSQDPALWKSESWRWFGIILNGVGALAGIFAVNKAFKWN
jgi:O-antigen/teichoic acid export membrane protein